MISIASMKRTDEELMQYRNLVGTYQKPGRIPKNLSWVHPGSGVTLASHKKLQPSSEMVDATG
ncbi:hypothetical protein [Bradyrhizobium retamae]|uniref:hypothetical protein n=1 Tax=Bradyrhizobium retamae TaxID=1300035 RepID=UPI0007106AAA|nr:hypothetical protein [Bradyrhizobium retamae]